LLDALAYAYSKLESNILLREPTRQLRGDAQFQVEGFTVFGPGTDREAFQKRGINHNFPKPLNIEEHGRFLKENWYPPAWNLPISVLPA
jgi:hypothetical protein